MTVKLVVLFECDTGTFEQERNFNGDHLPLLWNPSKLCLL
jgi:hypothetical protein